MFQLSVSIMLYVKCVNCGQSFTFANESEKMNYTIRQNFPLLDLGTDHSGRVPVLNSYCPMCFKQKMNDPEFVQWLRSTGFTFDTWQP